MNAMLFVLANQAAANPNPTQHMMDMNPHAYLYKPCMAMGTGPNTPPQCPTSMTCESYEYLPSTCQWRNPVNQRNLAVNQRNPVVNTPIPIPGPTTHTSWQTDAQGRTTQTTLITHPDGSMTRTVTGPDGVPMTQNLAPGNGGRRLEGLKARLRRSEEETTLPSKVEQLIDDIQEIATSAFGLWLAELSPEDQKRVTDRDLLALVLELTRDDVVSDVTDEGLFEEYLFEERRQAHDESIHHLEDYFINDMFPSLLEMLPGGDTVHVGPWVGL